MVLFYIPNFQRYEKIAVYITIDHCAWSVQMNETQEAGYSNEVGITPTYWAQYLCKLVIVFPGF